MRKRWVFFAASAVGIISIGWMISRPSLTPYAYLTAATPSKADGGLRVRFAGTATLSFDDGSTAIMTDGFFSRPGLLQVLFGKIEPNDQRIDEALENLALNNLAAILVAHSHYDHAMDSAVVALKTGAHVYGSLSTANIVHGSGLPADRMVTFGDGDTFSFGAFRVTVFQTPHSPNAKYPGLIDEPLHFPAKASEYHEGGNYSFLIQHNARRILVIPSCNFTPGKFAGVRADTVFLGIGTLGKQDEAFASAYWHEAVELTRAKLVIPIHWDDFMSPLDEPLQPMPRALDDFDQGMRMLLPLAKQQGVKIRLPDPFARIDLDS